MNLADMRAKLRRIIGNPTETAVPNSRLTELLNQGHRDIGDRYKFHNVRSLHSFPTVAGTARYTLPDDLTVLNKVWNASKRSRIRKRNPEDIANIVMQDPLHTGMPTHYIRFRHWIELTPIPDAAYTIGLYYKTRVADMVADADEPLLPVPWHNGLVLYTRWIYFDEQGQIDKAANAIAVWKAWLDEKPNEVDEEKMQDLDTAVGIPSLDPARWRYGSGNTNLDFETSE